MDIIPALSKNQLCVVWIPSSMGHRWLSQPLAALALRGPYRIIDAGGHLDPHGLARAVHAQGGDPDAALSRVYISRSFTCHQLAANLIKVEPSPSPLVVLGFLATFQDESVPLYERKKLFTICLPILNRIARSNPVLVTVKSSHTEFAAPLLKSAHQTFRLDSPHPPATLPLF